MIRMQKNMEGERYLFIYNNDREILAIDSANDPNDASMGGLYMWIFLFSSEELLGDDNLCGMDIDDNTGRLKIIGVDLL